MEKSTSTFQEVSVVCVKLTWRIVMGGGTYINRIIRESFWRKLKA